MSWPGYFISLEGLDGAGKSTQVAALAAALRADSHDVVVVRPSDTGVGELVRGFLLQHQKDVAVDPWAEALLFIASRVQLLRETIIPALQRGAVVIADRYADSTIAYQGGGRGLDIDLLAQLHAKACDDIWPDLTLWLDIPHLDAIKRQRGQDLPIDRFEREEAAFHRDVEATFARLAEAAPQRFVRIDATRPAVDVSEAIAGAVRSALAQHSSMAVSAAQ